MILEVVVTLGEIYDLFVREGARTDIRNSRTIQQKLSGAKKEYRQSPASLKKFFDKENFNNPYSDTRILCGDRDVPVKRILVGIDIEVGELLLADRLSEQGEKIDLVMAHHPEGVALAGLDDVMGLQVDILKQLGIEASIAQDLLNQRAKEVARRLHGANHTRTVDAANLLGIPLICCHTPADNHVAQYLQRLMDRKKPKMLAQVIDLLLKEPEYQDAATNKVGPQILIGKPKDKAGKIFVDMTGGTEGSKDIFARLSQLGIKTQLGMHLSEAHFDKIKSEHMNVVIAGHMASDNLGMNLLLDKLEKKGNIDIVSCSGFRRFRR